MESFLVAVNAVMPFLIYISFGYGVRMSGLVDEAFMNKLNKLIFRAFFPILMFNNLYKVEPGFTLDGRLVAVGSPEELGETLNPGSRLRATAQGETDTVLAAVRSVPGICRVALESAADGQVTFTAESEDAADRRAAVSRALTEAGCTMLALAAENRSLFQLCGGGVFRPGRGGKGSCGRGGEGSPGRRGGEMRCLPSLNENSAAAFTA